MEPICLPATDPVLLYRCRDGFYTVDLLTAALTEFDFFTWLDRQPSDLAGICQGLGTTPRPTDVMLTLFTAQGLVVQREGRFHNTNLARDFLIRSSPFFIGPYYAALKDRPVARDFIKVLRTGQTANWGSSPKEKPWGDAMLTEEFAAHFTAAMDCRGTYLGAVMAEKLDLRGASRLLDIAGGSGIYACALVARHPHLRATVFERPPVDQIAAKLIARRGCAAQVAVAAGDMFTDPLPTGFDLHLYSNVLHDWDTDKVRRLLAASFAALAPGGTLLIHDAHLNADKTGPLPVAEYSALLMNITEGKCYSVGEMDTLLREIGFTDQQFHPLAIDRSVISARKPASAH